MSEKGNPTEDKWREAVSICGRILSDRDKFDSQETDYKLKISSRVKALFDALEKGEDFVPLLKRAFSSPNNLTSFYYHGPFIDWAAEEQDDARQALLELSQADTPLEERVDRFLKKVPEDGPSGPGRRLSIASFLLMGLDPARNPMYRTTDYRTLERLLGWSEVSEGASPGETYAHHRAFAQRLLDELRSAGLDARDLLDAQSLIWILAKSSDQDIRAWRGEETAVMSALERAMEEFEEELDQGYLERHRERFEEARVRFDALFGSHEVIEELTPAEFFEFFNSIDAHGKPGAGLFTPNLPFPKNPETQSFQRLTEDIPALRQALIELLHGEGNLAERVDRMLAGPQVRTYITKSLPIPSMLLCFQNPEGHAGVQQMQVKAAKLEAVGELQATAEGDEPSIGQRFQLMEEKLARLPSEHGRDWDWAQRNLFYFSEAFRRNLEEDPLAEYVDRFYDERGYPTEQDEEHVLVRDELASYVSEEAIKDPNWTDFRRIFNAGYYGGTGPQSRLNSFISSAEEEDLEKLRRAVEHLLYSEELPDKCVDDLLEGEYKVPGLGESVATKLLAVCYPEEFLPVFVTYGDKGKIALMYHEALELAPPENGTRGEMAVRTNDILRDRLVPYFGDDTFGMAKFLYWLQLQDGSGDDEDSKKSDLKDLASSVYMKEDFLEEVIWLLREKGQVIFYGPPGTGKTFVARKLMKHLAPEISRREIVQFHPSYSYEDFVQGYRPVISRDGSLIYDLKPGPLMRLAEQAEEFPEKDHVLLIDEINRGNLPKILGELLYLLEYRDDQVALMYEKEGERFGLPENLLVIGTMNTADRSIALVDAALRRRFHFIPFFPGQRPLDGLLERWLKDNRPDMVEVAGIVDRLNKKLQEKFGAHLQLGPSYFMREDLSEEVLHRVWDHDIKPFLEDQFFGHEEELEEFELERLRGAADAADTSGGVQPEDGTTDEG